MKIKTAALEEEAEMDSATLTSVLTQGIAQKIQNTQRFHEIVRVLLRFGFAQFLEDMGVLEQGMRLLGLLNIQLRDPAEAAQPLGVRVRMVFSELGPTFIKAGQILSTRPDLVPPAICDELKLLQSDCPRVPFERIHEVLVQEFGGSRLEEVFEHIDMEPLAAASMAQVHRARLVSGEDVVLKILRPGIRETIRADIAVMSQLAALSESFMREQGFSPVAVVREFSKQLNKEIDLMLELQSTEKLTRLFRDTPAVRFPRMYKHASTRNVLCQERIRGTLLSAVKSEQRDPREVSEIVRIGVEAVFRMCLEFGFFHADPHPGNIFVLPGPVLVFIDLGMTGHIERKTTQDIADYFLGILQGDLDLVIAKAISLCRASPELEYDRSFRMEVHDYMSRFAVDELSFQGLDLQALMNEFFALVQKYHIILPADLVFLMKALVTIQGVGQELDPSFDLVGCAKPHLRNFMLRRYSPKELGRRLLKMSTSYIDFLEEGPSELRKLMNRIKSGDLSLRLSHSNLDGLTRYVSYSLFYIGFAIFSTGFMLSASMLGSVWLHHYLRRRWT